MQSRQARTRRSEANVRRPGPPSASRGSNPWQLIAIIALIAAAAGWTTAAILGSTLASRPETAAVASPDDSFDAGSSDDSEVPPEETHDAPELEALLPQALNGTALSAQSLTGDGLLLDNDTWSTTIRDFLTKSGKLPTDLRYAIADDPNQVVQDSVAVYQVTGAPVSGLLDALVAAWRVDYPDLKVTQVTLAGKTVTKLDFADDTVDSYMYLRDDVVFDIEATNDATAIAAIESLPKPGASGAPAGSVAPTGSGSPAPSTAPASKAPASSASPR